MPGCPPGIWTATMAANMMTQPRSSLTERASFRSIQPKSTENTDSRHMIRDASVGSAYFWPMIWQVYPTPPEKTPQ